MKTLLTTSLFLSTSILLYSQEFTVEEPEFINSVYVVKADGSTQRLEKAIPSQLTKRTVAGMLLETYDTNDFMQIQGNESSVKVKPMEQYKLIVRTYSNDIDPVEQISIVKMQSTRNNRVIKTTSNGLFGAYSSNDMDYIPYSGTKYGESSYLLSIDKNLEPGNYAVMIRNVSDVLNVFEVATSAQIKNEKYEETAKSQASTPVREQYTNDNDQAMTQGDFAILGGVSLWSGTYGGMPIFIAGDYMINDKISLGLEFSFTSYNPYDDIIAPGVEGNLTATTIGPRISYHLMEDLDLSNPSLDIYAGLFLGAIMVSTSIEDSLAEEDGGFGYYAFVGAKYQIGRNFYAFSELGYGFFGLKVGAAISF
ncbi:MAG: hypothetical protein ACOCWM_03205 [Cyclobacteriaceae bacterium]